MSLTKVTPSRTVCNFCLAKSQCQALRKKEHCCTCELALTCLMIDDFGAVDCETAKARWREELEDLHGKCLLIQSFLKEATKDEKFVSTRKKFGCPRCEQPYLTFKVTHSWKPLTKKRMSSNLHASCEICAVDESIVLK